MTDALRTAGLGTATLPPSANADADARAIYWFTSSNFITTTAPGASLPWKPPATGTYALRAVDDHGRADVTELRVGIAR